MNALDGNNWNLFQLSSIHRHILELKMATPVEGFIVKRIHIHKHEYATLNRQIYGLCTYTTFRVRLQSEIWLSLVSTQFGPSSQEHTRGGPWC